MRLVLLGAPGAGKGTQSIFIQEKFKIPSISTGGILRQAHQHNTELGNQAFEYIRKGQLVPDDLILKIVEERLSRPDCQAGYILDGFPRTINQAQHFVKFLESQKHKLDYAINLKVTDDVLVQRLAGRRLCRQCGAGYHVELAPPTTENICDRCGGELYQRSDDNEGTVMNRLRVYKKETAPLIDYFEELGCLYHIDGLGEAREVSQRIFEMIQ